jgi:hypothetical protein
LIANECYTIVKVSGAMEEELLLLQALEIAE